MKFWIGFTLGAAVAATVVNQMNEEQRATPSPQGQVGCHLGPHR